MSEQLVGEAGGAEQADCATDPNIATAGLAGRELGSTETPGRLRFEESPQDVESHYWVSTFPYFDTELFLVPSYAGLFLPAGAVHRLQLYDADGELINTAKVSFPARQAGIVGLDPLLGACKVESGMKHGHLVVRSPQGTRHCCRISNRSGGAILGPAAQIDPEHPIFFPVTIGRQRSYAAVVNPSATPARLRCRLCWGSRSPEAQYEIPAQGARVISVAAAFERLLADDQQRQAYLRLSVRRGSELAVHLFEHGSSESESNCYRTVC